LYSLKVKNRRKICELNLRPAKAGLRDSDSAISPLFSFSLINLYPRFSAKGGSASGGKKAGCRKDLFSLLKMKDFFFSETPQQASLVPR